MPWPSTSANIYIGVIKLADNSTIHFGPFPDYETADTFIQKKILEYSQAKCAYADSLITPLLFANRRV